MSLQPINLICRDLSDAWFSAVYNVLQHGREFVIDKGSYEGQKRLEFDYITIHITHPFSEPLLPQLPAHYNIPNPVENDYLNDYLPYLMTGELKEGESYTYGSRLVKGVNISSFAMHIIEEMVINKPDWITYVDFDKKFGYTVDQIKRIIWSYKNQGHRNNQMILQIAQPSDTLLKDPPCVIPDTQILTDKGYVKANEIKKGDIVLTHKGNWKKIKKVYKRKYKGEINNIKTRGFQFEIGLTPEHPINIVKIEKCPYDSNMNCKPNCKKRISSYQKNNRKCKEVFKTYKPEWEEAKKIKKDLYFIQIPKIKKEINCQFSDDEMYIFGLFLAEGWTSSKMDSLVFALGNHEKELIKNLKLKIKNVYNKNSTTYYDESANKTFVYSRKLAKKYLQMFGKYARHKIIPHNFVYFPEEKLKKLLDGYIDGDGYIRKNNVNRKTFYTSSKSLKEMFSLILLKLNIIPYITTGTPKPSIINGRIISSNGEGYNFEFIESKNKKQNSIYWEDDNYFYLKIKENNTSSYNGYVYNYEVEDDNSYIANGYSLHNCLRHIDTRMQDGKLHFYPYFRSWDLWGGFPANLAAIQMLKKYMADEIGVKDGEIICASKGLHLYDYTWELAEIIRGKTIKEFKGDK